MLIDPTINLEPYPQLKALIRRHGLMLVRWHRNEKVYRIWGEGTDILTTSLHIIRPRDLHPVYGTAP